MAQRNPRQSVQARAVRAMCSQRLQHPRAHPSRVRISVQQPVSADCAQAAPCSEYLFDAKPVQLSKCSGLTLGSPSHGRAIRACRTSIPEKTPSLHAPESSQVPEPSMVSSPLYTGMWFHLQLQLPCKLLYKACHAVDPNRDVTSSATFYVMGVARYRSTSNLSSKST